MVHIRHESFFRFSRAPCKHRVCPRQIGTWSGRSAANTSPYFQPTSEDRHDIDHQKPIWDNDPIFAKKLLLNTSDHLKKRKNRARQVLLLILQHLRNSKRQVTMHSTTRFLSNLLRFPARSLVLSIVFQPRCQYCYDVISKSMGQNGTYLFPVHHHPISSYTDVLYMYKCRILSRISRITHIYIES